MRARLLTAASVLALLGCADRKPECRDCDTVVIAATAEPPSIFPPMVYETVGRDISDLVFERLAVFTAPGVPIDPGSYRPGLAVRWERVDSLTWRFHLRPGARWHDGRPVTAQDVVFSFDAYGDSVVNAVARSQVAGRMGAAAEDDSTVLVRFQQAGPEQLYDATFHVRVLPRHVWDPIPRTAWESDTSLGHLVGSGPYRPVSRSLGQHLILKAVEGAGDSLEIRRLVWRFAPNPDAALNLVLAHEADLMESIGTPERVARVTNDSAFRTLSVPGATYGFLAFRLADKTGRAHPVLSSRAVRQGLTRAFDREALSGAFLGPGTRVPPGPMSQLLWIWSDSIRMLDFDTLAARRLVGQAARTRASPIDILVPSSSPARRQFALAIQQAWRKIGVASTVTAVDFAVFQERLAQGKFDAYVGAYLDEPSPRGLADQWSRAGWEVLNFGRYANPNFDSLLGAAGAARDVPTARRLWREAMDTLNADAAAIFLYAPVNVAAVNRRLDNVTIDPYSWLANLPDWRISRDGPSAVSSR